MMGCIKKVRFTPESGHSSERVGCPKSANSGHLTLYSGAVTDLAPNYGAHVAKRDSPLPNLVPESHPYTSDALQQGKTPDGSKLRVIS
jgi:hypothetical protein